MDAPDRAKPDGGSLLASIGLAVGATLVFLLLLELAGRVFEQVDPPADHHLARGREKRVAVPDPVPGAYRIFLYGGSTIVGAPVTELSYLAQLEFWLERLSPDRPVQIVNFAVNGRPSGYALAELERTLPHRPDLVIVLTAHNDFQRWKPEGDWDRLRRSIGGVLEQTAVARTLRRAGYAVRDRAGVLPELRPPLWIVPEDRDGERFRERAEGYRTNTREIVRRTREAGVPLILATGPANLSDWPPVHRFVHDADYAPRMQAIWDRIRQGDLAGAEAGLQRGSETYPGDAMIAWLTGRLAAARGDTSEAAAFFDLAADLDPIPWRVLTAFNDHVRELGLAAGVHLADVDAAFRREAADGLVGWELVADNCHPTPYGGAILARELLLAMARAGLLIDAASLQRLPGLDDQWKVFEEAALRARPGLWLEYLLTNARYVMKWPFYHFEASRRYLEQARALAPDEWQVPANLGSLAVLEGRLDEGRRQLERAEALFGGPLVVRDRNRTPYLREATALLSGELPAFVPPEVE
ncbi:MAG: GDSL-type esterase/lipase family protein [Myxococcota bacterium]